MSELSVLWARRRNLSDQIAAVDKKIAHLTLLRDRAKHTCDCVALNRSIDIYDMRQQEHAGRRGLGVGLVAETLSAVKECPRCHGTGKLGDAVQP